MIVVCVDGYRYKVEDARAQLIKTRQHLLSGSPVLVRKHHSEQRPRIWGKPLRLVLGDRTPFHLEETEE